MSGLLVYLADNKTRPQEQKQGLLYRPVRLEARLPRFDTTQTLIKSSFYSYRVYLVAVGLFFFLPFLFLSVPVAFGFLENGDHFCELLATSPRRRLFV